MKLIFDSRMDKKKPMKMINATSTQKTNNSQDDFNIIKKKLSNSNSNLNNIGTTNSSINSKNSINYRSKSNLTAKDKNITKGLKSNV